MYFVLILLPIVLSDRHRDDRRVSQIRSFESTGKRKRYSEPANRKTAERGGDRQAERGGD